MFGKQNYFKLTKPRNKSNAHPEDDLQMDCVAWFKLQYPHKKIWATPNGGKRNKFEAFRLKKMGVLAGVLDLFIPARFPLDKCHGIFIEMKSEKGTWSDSQEEFRDFVTPLGYMCYEARTLEAFQKIVNNYFQGGDL